MTQEAAKKERVAKVIEVLNKARSMELYAVHQYMNQHYNLDETWTMANSPARSN